MKNNKMATKTMTKEQAEKAALEFAMVKYRNGWSVTRVELPSEIRVMFGSNFEAIPFIDLVPGDACLVWDEETGKELRMFSRVSDGGYPLFTSGTRKVGDYTCGVRYDNYRPLGFNVLEIEKGWGEDGK